MVPLIQRVSPRAPSIRPVRPFSRKRRRTNPRNHLMSPKTARLTFALALLASVLALAPVAGAQESSDGTITVNVTDRDGNVLAGMTVQLLGPTRQVVRESDTDEMGVAALEAIELARRPSVGAPPCGSSG